MKDRATPSLRGLTRRHFFEQASFGIGGLALASLLDDVVLAERAVGQEQPGSETKTAARRFPARAKRVIFLFMAGAPSQIDLFDPKPALIKHDGQDIPEEFVKGERFAFIKGQPKLLASPFQFKSYGQSGAQISELLPNLAKVADDITIIRSMRTTQFNHAPAQIFMNTGAPDHRAAEPGLVAELRPRQREQRPPGLRRAALRRGDPDGGKSYWGSGFLPDACTRASSSDRSGDPVLFVSNPDGHRLRRARPLDDAMQRPQSTATSERRRSGDRRPASAEYEMAYRMQTSVPELMDIVEGAGGDATSMYGAEPGKASFANNCLLARRLVERGVRFVQLYHRGWDTTATCSARHREQLPQMCRQTDQPVAALLTDLKQRGLLDDTLVVWGGEFGRTPMSEGTERLETPGPRSSPARASPSGWPAAASGRASPTAAPTSSATTSSRTPSTSTTCTRRSCTCWASITTSSPTASRAAISG